MRSALMQPSVPTSGDLGLSVTGIETLLWCAGGVGKSMSLREFSMKEESRCNEE
jgi:hypothetical protein